jgi:hypothetical protein
MKYLTLAPIVLVVLAAACLAPALAQPNFDKYEAPLDDCGKVIFNTNWEDEFGGYELEVEVEECLDLAESTVNVSLDGELIGTIEIDEFGNGKATFYVEDITTEYTITVEGAVTLTSGDWVLWMKGPCPK